MAKKKSIKIMTGAEYKKANPKMFPKVEPKKIDQGKIAGADEEKKEEGE